MEENRGNRLTVKEQFQVLNDNISRLSVLRKSLAEKGAADSTIGRVDAEIQEQVNAVASLRLLTLEDGPPAETIYLAPNQPRTATWLYHPGLTLTYEKIQAS